MQPRLNTQSELIKHLLNNEAACHEFSRSLADPAIAPEDKLANAMSLLGLNEKDALNQYKFKSIHTLVLKQEHLQYKYLKAEFLIEKKLLTSPNNQNGKLLHRLIEQAQGIVSHSELITKHEQQYSVHSYGLSQLDKQASYKKSKSKELIQSMLTSDLNASMLPIGEKKSGAEPGFEAIQVQDILFYIFHTQKTKEERIAFIREHHADYKKIYEKFSAALPKYLVKLDYKKINDEGIVTPDTNDLQRTNSIQNFGNPVLRDIAARIYAEAKKASFSSFNCDAVLEVVANDIARLFGMDVQDQVLFLDYHTNGLIKFMLNARWVKGADILKIAGDEKDGKSCVIELDHPQQNVKYLSDHTIENLPEFFALLAWVSDRDSIGSQGQNKLQIGRKMIGIDFGKAFPQDPIAKKIRMDFKFDNKEYKNYSIFYDAPRSELMKGIIKLAILSGNKINSEVLNSYGPEFKRRLHGLSAGLDEEIFANYVEKLSIIRKQITGQDSISKQNRDSLDAMVAKVVAVRASAVESRNILVQTFLPYLTMTKTEIDLIENLEKLWSGKDGTTRRSPDKTVMLHHLRIIKQNVVKWQHQPDVKECKFSVEFKDNRRAEKALAALDGWQKDNIMIMCERNKKELTISFPRYQLTAVSQLFAESNLMKAYHADDYDLYQACHAEYLHRVEEEQLRRQVATFSVYNVDCELKKNDSQYQLNVKVSKDVGSEKIDVILYAILPQHLRNIVDNYSSSSTNMSFNFVSPQLADINKALVAIHHAYQREVQINRQRETFNLNCDLIRYLPDLKSDLKPRFEHNREQSELIIDIQAKKDPKLNELLQNALASYPIRNQAYIICYNDFSDFNEKIYGVYLEYVEFKAEEKRIELEQAKLAAEAAERLAEEKRLHIELERQAQLKMDLAKPLAVKMNADSLISTDLNDHNTKPTVVPVHNNAAVDEIEQVELNLNNAIDALKLHYIARNKPESSEQFNETSSTSYVSSFSSSLFAVLKSGAAVYHKTLGTPTAANLLDKLKVWAADEQKHSKHSLYQLEADVRIRLSHVKTTLLPANESYQQEEECLNAVVAAIDALQKISTLNIKAALR